MSRGRVGPVFSRDTDSTERNSTTPDWLCEYAKNLEKNSVHSVDQDRSLFDQISEIMGTKSKFSTVDDAVRDMRERTGLNVYLRQVAATVKQASESTDIENLEVSLPKEQLPPVFEENPEVEKFIKKYVESRKGHTSIAAVLVDIGRLFKDIDTANLDDKELKRYINNVITAERQNHVTKEISGDLLGQIDDSDKDFEDSDAFRGLMPAKF